MINVLCNNIASLNNAVDRDFRSVDLVRNSLTVGLLELLLRKRMIAGMDLSHGRYVSVGLIRGLRFRIRPLTKPSRHVYMGRRELNRRSFGNGYWVLSTSTGSLMDSYECLDRGIGGLVLCGVHFPNR